MGTVRYCVSQFNANGERVGSWEFPSVFKPRVMAFIETLEKRGHWVYCEGMDYDLNQTSIVKL